MIVIISGLPGVGKTTLAEELAPLINCVILSTDKIRKELIPKPTYTKEEKKMVYDVLLLITKYLHDAGINCILDATFNKESYRNQVKKVLGLSQNEFHIVECVCPENVVISRLGERKKGFSDADFAVYQDMKKQVEPIHEPHIIADTNNPPTKVAKIVSNQILQRK